MFEIFFTKDPYSGEKFIKAGVAILGEPSEFVWVAYKNDLTDDLLDDHYWVGLAEGWVETPGVGYSMEAALKAFQSLTRP
jgi:hypothetical protein